MEEAKGLEVHVPNVPAKATQTNFRKFLHPYVSQLAIQSWRCEKNPDRNFATLTFLHIDDGQKFLKIYGSAAPMGNRRTTRANNNPQVAPQAPRVLYGGQTIYFRRSNRSPNHYTILSLEKEAKDRAVRKQQQLVSLRIEQPRELEVLPISFNTCSVSCGVWSYEGVNPVYQPQLTWPVRGEAKFGEHSVILKLDSGVRIDFLYFSTLCISTEEGRTPSLIFSMQEAPRFFQKIDDALNILLSQLNINNGRQGLKPKKGPERHRFPSLSSEHQLIAGSCLVYRVEIQGETSIIGQRETIAAKMQRIRKVKGTPPISHRQTIVRQPSETFSQAYRSFQLHLSSITGRVPFRLSFQLQKLAQGGYLPPRTVTQILPEVKEMLGRNPKSLSICVEAVKKLFFQINFPGPDTESSEFDVAEIIAQLRKNEENCQLDRFNMIEAVSTSSNVAIVHRVTVTPTSIRLEGPTPESNNRVLRQYPNHHEFFLRVRFCDEDGQPVRFNPKVSLEKIYQGRFKDVLENGIKIADRVFTFLGFSHSSLRNQSCWFMAPFIYKERHRNHKQVIQDLGNFDHIQCPAKYAARIGQVFSDTRTAIAIEDSVSMIIEDVERDDRVFSDGVGTMSKSVMLKIWDVLPKNKLVKPTHFQIRYKGAKGMIGLDNTLKGDILNLRPSMIKFDGSTWPDIEICDATYKPLPVYLNRQFIKILEDMGVPEDYFLNLQEKEVRHLRDSTADPTNASSFLKRQSIGDSISLPWFINELQFLEIDFRQDGFLRDVLEMALLTELRLLKHKTRIPVEKGWHLHGLMDETGFLNEGEVYVSVVVDGMQKFYAQENVIVTRAPALHPGDVQIANAVIPPANSPLRQLFNCICFSSKGPRDLPSQLSGGDLDGDRFQVIWDKNCRPKQTYVPADYPRQPPVDIGRPVEIADTTNFFLQFMETDQLGRIAVAHRVLADQKSRGTLDLDCITLAEMHSTAVDFSKTGIPVEMAMMPRKDRHRPDFEAPGPHVKVEKDFGVLLEADVRDPDDVDDEDDDFVSYRYYESKKVLGKLYRAIDECAIFEQIKQRAQHGVTSESTVINTLWARIQQKCMGFSWEHKKKWARDLQDNYEENLLQIMQECAEHPLRPVSELEAFVGAILGKAGAQNRHQREVSMTMKERFDESANFIVDCIRKDGEDWSEESLERSMACLAVSLEDRPRKKKTQTLMSFKYLAASVCLRESQRVLEFRDDPFGFALSTNGAALSR